MITVLWREREGRLLPNLLVFPFSKLPAVVLNEFSLGAGAATPAPFLPGLPGHRVRGHGAAVHSPHLLPHFVWSRAESFAGLRVWKGRDVPPSCLPWGSCYLGFTPLGKHHWGGRLS